MSLTDFGSQMFLLPAPIQMKSMQRCRAMLIVGRAHAPDSVLLVLLTVPEPPTCEHEPGACHLHMRHHNTQA
jgi:hypothetical protein